MKKTLIIAGILGAFATAAHAQSSVTLYGSLDAGIVYVNNVGSAGYIGSVNGGPQTHGSVWAQYSGALADNYFGFKGVEDLGGGTKAIFKLESGFSISNGGLNNGGLFNRQAYVGLENAQFGTLTLGRQYDSIVDYLSPLALAGQAGGVNLAGHPFNNDNVDGLYSISNTVKYQSPNFSGLQATASYSFSGTPGGFNQGRSWSVGAGYSNGPLKVGAAYDQLNNPGLAANAGAGGVVPGALAGATLQDGGSLGSVDVQRTFGVGANYAFGPGTVGLLWTHSRYQDLGGDNSGVALRFDNIEVNGSYLLTPALAVVGNYTYTWGKVSGLADPNGNDLGGSAKWHSVTLGLDYSLSKRTDAYLAGVYQHASKALASNADYYIPDSTSIGGLVPSSSTQSQVGVGIGLRHRF